MYLQGGLHNEIYVSVYFCILTLTKNHSSINDVDFSRLPALLDLKDEDAVLMGREYHWKSSTHVINSAG